jgi:hypothetical protein
MALDTYAALQAAVADYLARSDLTSQIPDFITLNESRMNKVLRTRYQETVSTITIDAATEALPTDFLEARTFVLSSSPNVVLEFMSPTDLETTYASGAAGRPLNFAIIGSNFKFGPTPDATYSGSLTYYAKIPALSDSNTTNWLLTNYPDLYLYGTLMEAAPFCASDDRIPIWMGLYDRAIAGLSQADERARWNGSPLVTRTDINVSGRIGSNVVW